MRKAVSILFLVLLPLCARGQKVREAQFAGTFYDSRPKALSQQVDNYLGRAQGEARQAEKPCVLIVPHAGYSCSGPVAASAYRLVQGLDFETVVIVGTSHQGGLSGCSIYPEGGYQTPLGVAIVDASLSQEISRISGFTYFPSAHQNEHSIEVQIPFIQKVLPRAKIVPILMGTPSPKTISTLAESLVQALRGKRILLVVSTDLSHYYPKDKANSVDGETVALIKGLKTDILTDKLQKGENIMCGGGGVVSALLYAQALGSAEIDILQYADSSSTCGPPSEVVGYMAAAVFVHNEDQALVLSEKSKKELLDLARVSLELFIRKQEIIAYSPQNRELLGKRGVFVTLKKKDALRGCIGFIEPVGPIHQTVIQASIYASSKDPRFKPVTSDELDEIDIEISVLTPMRKISDPSLVEVGKHGLFVKWKGRSGLLLPQVPVENGWSRRTFLEQACLKAGLSKDAWKSGAKLYVFEADVFRP
jgi:AmmeMemoRadiSam system protein B/AmmeMemoRadiSam system protein A